MDKGGTRSEKPYSEKAYSEKPYSEKAYSEKPYSENAYSEKEDYALPTAYLREHISCPVRKDSIA